MHHHVFRMQAEQHVWENGIIKNADAKSSLADVAHGKAQALPLMVRLLPLDDPHEPAEERSFASDRSPRNRTAKFRKLRMHSRAVIALRIIFEHQLPIGLHVVIDRFRRAQLRQIPMRKLSCQRREPFLQRSMGNPPDLRR